MLKIYYPICCGIDVHKKMLVATIASTNERKVTTYQTKQFTTFTKDSIWIADIFKYGLVEGSFMSPLAIRQLRV